MKFFSPFRVFLFLSLICLAFGCSSSSSSDSGGGGGDGDGGGGGGGGSITTSGVNLIMSSGQIANTNIAAQSIFGKEQEQTDCMISVSPGQGLESGKCITPLNISGEVSSISVASQYPGDSARILGGGSELALKSTGAVDVESFVLSEASQIYAGEDTIPTTTYYYDRLFLLLASLDVKFAAASKYFTVRYVFFQQPVLDNSIINECLTEEHYREDVEANGELFPGMSFQSGDILVCQKDSTDDTCLDTDFQWVDTNAGTLSSDRSSIAAANLARLTGDEAQAQDVDCENNGGDMSLGGLDLPVNISTAFVITAVTNSDGTSKTYTYTPDCTSTDATTGSCTGTEETGTNLAFLVDFDLAQAVFVGDDIDDIDAVSVQDFLKNITSVMLKPLYVLNNTSVPSSGLDMQWDVSVSASLTGTTFGTCTTDDECHTWAATIATESAAELGATNTINIQNAVCATFVNGSFCTRECAGNDIMHGICPTVKKGYGWGGVTGAMDCTTDTGGDTTQECPAGETCHCTFPAWY